MWKVSLFCNILILSLLWLLSQVVITPVHNLFFQYAETGMALPILTDFAIQLRSPSAAIPLTWIVFTFFYGRWMKNQTADKRNEWLSFHTSLTLCIGLLVLLFFSLAGILPILKIGYSLN